MEAMIKWKSLIHVSVWKQTEVYIVDLFRYAILAVQIVHANIRVLLHSNNTTINTYDSLKHAVQQTSLQTVLCSINLV